MDPSEILKELKIDIRSLLLDQKVDHLEKLLDNAIEAKVARMNSREVKGFLVGMLLTGDNFSLEDLVAAMDFRGSEISLADLLEEPDEENEMKKPVMEEFPGDKYKVATEVPLPSEKRNKAGRVDVAALKKGMLGGNQITAFELKMSPTRGEVLKAFAQAKSYLEFCDSSCVALSPIAYIKQYDTVEKQMEEYPDLGVWVVNRRKKLAELKGITLVGEASKGKAEVAAFIEGEASDKKGKSWLSR